jgi:hypothetical protein
VKRTRLERQKGDFTLALDFAIPSLDIKNSVFPMCQREGAAVLSVPGLFLFN